MAFRHVDNEVVSIMRKVKQAPLVLDIVKRSEELLKRLENLNESLSNIQKALGNYLERQRAAFPRFYFVGDEDLLEIIGNSSDMYADR